MIFANGKRYPSQEQNRLLSEMEEEINRTLAEGTPPTPEQIISACEYLAGQAFAGVFDAELAGLGLDESLLRTQMSEVAALMSRESLTAKVREELGENWGAERTMTPPHDTRPLTKKRMPLGVLLHIAAGNVDGLPAYSVVEGLLAGNINILKLPSADNGLSLRMLEELVKAQPVLAPYVYVFDTPSEDVEAILTMAKRSDGVVVWGGDGATSAVRQMAPAGIKIIEWGHKLSFAYATPEGVTEEALGQLARHIVQTRQLLCSSCQTLFLDTEDQAQAEELCRRMVKHLEAAAAEAPPLDIGSRGQVTLGLYTQELEQRAGHTSRKLFRGKGCSVTLCEEGPPELSPQFGNLLVKPLPRQRLMTALRKEKTHLQTAALLCAPEEKAGLTDLLFRAGLIRVTAPGDMSHTTALDAHDGEYPLLRYTKVAEQR